MGFVAAASILISASEHRLRFMLLASVKSVFSRSFDVGSIVCPHGEEVENSGNPPFGSVPDFSFTRGVNGYLKLKQDKPLARINVVRK